MDRTTAGRARTLRTSADAALAANERCDRYGCTSCQALAHCPKPRSMGVLRGWTRNSRMRPKSGLAHLMFSL